jgi:uracil-DNA glycosylase
MKNRQMMVMRELGLTPVYRLRGQDSPAVEEISASASNTPVPEIKRPVATSTQSSGNPQTPMVQGRQATILQMDWPELKAKVAGCVDCRLHAGRNKTVFGVGDEKASWLFVGEGPGADEDRQGEPFVGQAGKLLDSMLAAIDLKRGDDVYIANVVKCRPPGNRNPQSDEAQTCEPYLMRQIQLIKPTLIVALGKIAAQNLLGTDAAVGSLRGGKLHDYKGTPLIVTYHPAYLLRNPADKARVWEDLCFARTTMRGLKSTRATT